jgi:hypothetical protein
MQLEFNFASLVPKTAKQEAEACSPVRWDWVEAAVWTERMLAALGNGVKGGKWSQAVAKCLFAERGLFTVHEAYVLARQSR